MSRLGDLLRQDETRLAQISGMPIAEARFEAQLLMAHALRVNRAWLLAHDRDPLPDEAAASYRGYLERRLRGEPVAYIFGEKEFYGLLLTVNADVLIPRPETELLVDLALERMPADEPLQALDLGTGSGAIALALAKFRPLGRYLAVDASAAALQVARGNAARLQLRNVHFLESDWWRNVSIASKFNVIVSNPPYIAAGDRHLQAGDLRFEPLHALAAGTTGLDDLQTIVGGARDYLAPGGSLLLEHGYEQGAAVRQLLAAAGFGDIQTHRDPGGRERVTAGKIKPD
ncbi:MAG TPA: peptide chain release factor N(5)-glutamine methyltransferase [Burkholderiales bacterium]|nr:peptide chain release factor N(5)-glutamine methyltransferase [Burkholderiales bacterium]